jgi:hypothetical protein
MAELNFRLAVKSCLISSGAVDLFVIARGGAADARQSSRRSAGRELDCFVASLLAMTEWE